MHALISNKIYPFDEPTALLDQTSQLKVLKTIKILCDKNFIRFMDYSPLRRINLC